MVGSFDFFLYPSFTYEILWLHLKRGFLNRYKSKNPNTIKDNSKNPMQSKIDITFKVEISFKFLQSPFANLKLMKQFMQKS